MKINKAIEILKGYCAKQIDCKHCRFAYGKDICDLRDYAPCDWNVPDKK
jgi:hypothetical protein